MSYYTGGKRVMRAGAPCKVASWVGELGNDKEYKESTKPRTAFKSAYYLNGYRMVIGGVPVRVAAYVQGWAPWMKRALGKGSASVRELEECKRQMQLLFAKSANV